MPPDDPARSTLPVTRREIFGWAMFDFANSSYTTIVVTVVFSVYFTKVVVVGDGPAWTDYLRAAGVPLGLTGSLDHVVGNLGDFLWGLGITVSNVIVVASAPIVGALADDSGRKKLFLGITYVMCVAGTALLALVTPGRVTLALLLFIISNVAYASGENFAGAFLPEISTPKNIGKISGFGWGLGYLGGLGCLVLLQFTVLPKEMTADAAGRVQLAMLVTAVFFGVAALPTFLFLKERAPRGPQRTALEYTRIGFRRLADTTRSLRHFSELVRFLIVFFVFSCGLMTVIAYAAIFAEKTLAFTLPEIVLLFLIVQISAAAGAVGFGWLQDKIGARRTIQVALIIWIVVCVVSFLTHSKMVFFGVVLLAGLGIGSLQSASRGMVGLFSPTTKSGEFFGFWGLAGKAAYAVGPIAFGIISSATGSQRLAMLSTTAFFVLGMIGMAFVSETRGREAAASWVEPSATEESVATSA